MDELPMDVMFNIFSRIPLKPFASFRCVSKTWCKTIDEPHLAVLHLKQQGGRSVQIPLLFRENSNPEPPYHILSLHAVGRCVACEYEVKRDPVSEFHSNQPFPRKPPRHFLVHNSCNGLLCFLQMRSQKFGTSVVANPFRGELYKLPPMMDHLQFQFSSSRIFEFEACGLRFDDHTNSFKVVCVYSVWEDDLLRVHIMVHVLETSSWRQVSHRPTANSYDHLIYGKTLFAHGSLHWLAKICGTGDVSAVICYFDVRKEEYRSIDPPKTNKYLVWPKLVDLNGELGLAYSYHDQVEVWLMKEYSKKDWVIYCQIYERPPFHDASISVIGIWNEEGGDMLSLSEKFVLGEGWKGSFFLYNLKTEPHPARPYPLSITGIKEPNPYIHTYSCGLFSIRRIMENAYGSKTEWWFKCSFYVLSGDE